MDQEESKDHSTTPETAQAADLLQMATELSSIAAASTSGAQRSSRSPLVPLDLAQRASSLPTDRARPRLLPEGDFLPRRARTDETSTHELQSVATGAASALLTNVPHVEEEEKQVRATS